MKKNLLPAVISKLLFVFLLATGCTKDQDSPGGNGPEGPHEELKEYPVLATVQGRVLDGAGKPLVNVDVRIGNVVATKTDQAGVFIFRGAYLDKYTSVITANKSGFFPGRRSFSIKHGAHGFIEIQLMNRSGPAIYYSDRASTLSPNSFSSVALPANGFISLWTNQLFKGAIAMYEAEPEPWGYGDRLVQGSYMGIDSQGNRVLLNMLATQAMDFAGTNQEPLKLAPGAKAKIQIRIPETNRAIAPAEAPLWSFNPYNGLWMQVAMGKRVENAYVAEVSDLTLPFWSFATTVRSVFAEVTLKTTQGNPVQFTKARVTGQQSGVRVYAHTDSAGVLAGFVPFNEPVKVEIFNACDQVLSSKELPGLTGDRVLPTIVIDPPAQSAVQLTGVALNCQKDSVKRGVAEVFYDGRYYPVAVRNGKFSATFVKQCAAGPVNSTIFITDSTSRQRSLRGVFTNIGTAFDAGITYACEKDLESYIRYKLANSSYEFSSAAGDTVVGSANNNYYGTLFPFVHGMNGSRRFHMEFDQTIGPGTFGVHNLEVYNATGYLMQPFKVNITKFGEVGQFIDGNFDGWMQTGPGAAYQFSGSFHTRRIE